MQAIGLIRRFYSGFFLANFLITLSCLGLLVYYGEKAHFILSTLIWYKLITMLAILGMVDKPYLIDPVWPISKWPPLVLKFKLLAKESKLAKRGQCYWFIHSANPTYKTVNLFDHQMKKIKREELFPPAQKQANDQKQTKQQKEELPQKKQNKSRKVTAG